MPVELPTKLLEPCWGSRQTDRRAHGQPLSGVEPELASISRAPDNHACVQRVAVGSCVPLCLGIALAGGGQKLRNRIGVWLRHGDFPPDTRSWSAIVPKPAPRASTLPVLLHPGLGQCSDQLARPRGDGLPAAETASPHTGGQGPALYAAKRAKKLCLFLAPHTAT